MESEGGVVVAEEGRSTESWTTFVSDAASGLDHTVAEVLMLK